MLRIRQLLVAAFLIMATTNIAEAQSCPSYAEPPVQSCGFPYFIPGTPGHHVVYMDTATSGTPGTLCGSSTTNVASPAGYTPLSQLDDDDDDDSADDAEDDLAGSTPNQTTQTSASTTSTPKGAKVPTKEGRLQVPINMVRSVGWFSGETVYIGQHGSELRIRPYIHGSNTNPVTVNKDGRIRICNRTLKKTIGVSTSYTVNRTNGEIVVTQ